MTFQSLAVACSRGVVNVSPILRHRRLQHPRDPDATPGELSTRARLLLWDYERGSLPYDVLCVLMLLFLWLVSGKTLADPMGGLPLARVKGALGDAP
jgi:hypothetical protein